MHIWDPCYAWLGTIHKRRRHLFSDILNSTHTVLCIDFKVAVFYQQTKNYDFYEFYMPFYVRKSIYNEKLDEFGYTDIYPFYLRETDKSPLVEERERKNTQLLSVVKWDK